MSTPNEPRTITLREYIEQRLSEMDKATIIQAKEYERRLTDLNDEYGRAADVLRTYIPRELFDTFVSEYRKAHQVLKDSLNNYVTKEQYIAIIAKVERMETWQIEQAALNSQREKSTNIRLSIITGVLILVEIILRFVKVG